MLGKSSLEECHTGKDLGYGMEKLLNLLNADACEFS